MSASIETWFELWDGPSASLVGTYDSRAAALAIVQRTLATYGDAAVECLILTEERDGHDPEVVAAGHDLIDLARRSSRLASAVAE